MSNLLTLSNLNFLPTYCAFDEFDSLFNSLLSNRRSGSRLLSLSPCVNVEETSSGYNIFMAAPGLSRDDFKIQVDAGCLKISVDQKPGEKEKEKWITREYSYASFSRSWKLPANVDTSSIGARYEAGILSVHVPVSNKKSTNLEIKVQ